MISTNLILYGTVQLLQPVRVPPVVRHFLRVDGGTKFEVHALQIRQRHWRGDRQARETRDGQQRFLGV